MFQLTLRSATTQADARHKLIEDFVAVWAESRYSIRKKMKKLRSVKLCKQRGVFPSVRPTYYRGVSEQHLEAVLQKNRGKK